MNVSRGIVPGVLVVEPQVFRDRRGFLMETYHKARYREAGIDVEFVQHNCSMSRRGTLRGLHYQIEHPQGKLCRAVHGEIFDVAVDLRRGSPTFGQWFGTVLSEHNQRQLYLPPGLAHGFCVVSETAEFFYMCTDYYYPQHDRTILWNDPSLAIDWPIHQPILSEKDRLGLAMADAPSYAEGVFER